MDTTVLDNGLKVIHIENNSDVACVFVNVKVGSNSESSDVAGISHFIEHMVFEGTKKRPDSFQISNEIEKLGGELNAATSNERTYFYAKVPQKHSEVAMDIISDILTEPMFDKKLLEKEKGIVCDEISLINDQPRFYQWILFQKKLFEKHPAGNPVYGKVEVIKSMDRDKVLRYFSQFYYAQNMTLVLSGKKDMVAKAQKYFSNIPSKSLTTNPAVFEDENQKRRMFEEHRGTEQAYMILGFKTPPRNHKDTYTLDIMRAVLGRGQSGKIFDEIRTKRGLAYDVGVVHNPSTDFGYFAIYVNTNKKNIKKCEELIIEEIHKLKNITKEELDEAKTFLEGEYILQREDSQKIAESVSFWDQISKPEDMDRFLEQIKAVKKQDIVDTIGRYILNQTIVVLN